MLHLLFMRQLKSREPAAAEGRAAVAAAVAAVAAAATFSCCGLSPEGQGAP